MKLIFITCMLFLTQEAVSQNSGIFVGARFGHLVMEDFTARNYGGIELDIQFENNVGIQYSLLAGNRYFHMPVGLPVGLAVGLAVGNYTRWGDSSFFGVGLGVVFGIATAIIPETISYNVVVHFSSNT